MQLYKEVAKALNEMKEMFPFPHGGEPSEAIQKNRAIELLYQAKEAEVAGVKELEKLLDFMKAYYAEVWIN
ncbi:hypothetical protein [Alkalihalobacillus pseudalcaliphilus]|uniref:hypothetical protein n=1 Tax=Alkalihalobacillus pseudalcaliphilus TaxID=79884 RepID=UPI00064DEAF5|nr:hypothetical protein [Alkalihalobacillus pseudalcaliphilus]KMK77181.1 hypothetical protein AB990_06425 [Alkalihalobacillus pseudalcaliphilus]